MGHHRPQYDAGAGLFAEKMPALSDSLKPNRALRLSQAFSKLLSRARLASVTATRSLRLGKFVCLVLCRCTREGKPLVVSIAFQENFYG